MSPTPALAAPDAPHVSRRSPDIGAIYRAEVGYVWNLVRRLGVPSRDLEDVVHDGFVVLHRRRDVLDPARPVRPWLAGICYRVVSESRRRALRRREVVGQQLELVDRGPGPESMVASRSLLMEALETLELERRTVFVLHEVEGYTMPEIAAILQAPQNTLYSRLRAARRQLAVVVRRLSDSSPTTTEVER